MLGTAEAFAQWPLPLMTEVKPLFGSGSGTGAAGAGVLDSPCCAGADEDESFEGVVALELEELDDFSRAGGLARGFTRDGHILGKWS
jgi:hypothetical protein